MSTKSNSSLFTVKSFAFCAISLAIGTVLSFVKLPVKLPYGGSATLLSMFMITLPGFWFGLPIGLASAVGYGLLQFLCGPYILSIPQVICDYFLAFGALGLSGVFHNKKHGLVYGYLLAIFGRFVFSVLSGVVFFAEYAAEFNMLPLLYSIAYNGAYIGTEGVITIVLIALPPVKRVLNQVKQIAM